MNRTELGHGMTLHADYTHRNVRIVIRLNHTPTRKQEVVRFLLVHYITAYLKR